jgi:hypothetical protein
MSSYLHEISPQVWWMVDIGFSHALEDCPQTQAQEKCLYLEAQSSNALSSALSAELEDMIKIEYGLLERANLLWNMLEQMFSSSNDKRSSLRNVPESISSSSMNIDQDQEQQSSVQKEKGKVCQSGKPRWSGFPNWSIQFLQNKD